MSTRVIVLYHEEIEDDFFGPFGRCFMVRWPKAQAGEPREGDMLEVVKKECFALKDGVPMAEPRIRWRWKVLKTERASRGEFGLSDNLVIAVA